MNYEQEYNKLVNAIKVLQEENPSDEGIQNWVSDNVPELRKSEDEKIREDIIHLVNAHGQGRFRESMLAWLEKQGTSYTKRDIDDAYIKGMSDAKRELEKQGEKKCIDDLTQQEAMDIAVAKCFEQGGQKPTWSEEDEVRLQACIDTLQAKSIMGKVDTIQTNWLRSLKQRYTWKPSKEQMDAMQMAVSYFDYSWISKEQKLLESLYKDLKKLTEG